MYDQHKNVYVCLLRQLSQTLNGECIHFWVEQKRTSRRSSTWKPPSLRRKRLQGRVWMWPKPLLDWPRARPYPWEKIKGRENLQAGNTTQRCRWVLFLSSRTELGQSRNLSFLKLLKLQIECAFMKFMNLLKYVVYLLKQTIYNWFCPFWSLGQSFFAGEIHDQYGVILNFQVNWSSELPKYLTLSIQLTVFLVFGWKCT